jgi:hypothetical protein
VALPSTASDPSGVGVGVGRETHPSAPAANLAADLAADLAANGRAPAKGGADGVTTDPVSGGYLGGADFKGKHPQQFAVWGQSMAVAAAFNCFWCGLFTAVWAAQAK